MWPPPLPSQKDPRGATAPFVRLLPGEAASSPPVRSEADVFHADLRYMSLAAEQNKHYVDEKEDEEGSGSSVDG
ncbi:unnamed protein product [Heligmosomoides polygyrus]|uniref:Uncharacterized protein n=1 Tax=Heligmosomoides polygyrus TaxID=6339 RepID=A0A183GCY3_HELPZ|nr:unnamed protein product [Heligmosomoides polygyrus]